MSDFLETAILSSVLNGLPFTQIPDIYIALYNTIPTDAGGGIEVTATDYVRLKVTGGFTVLGTATKATNTNALKFPVAGVGGWGNIVGVGLFDAVTEGNLLFWGSLTANQQVPQNGIFQFEATTLGITLA